MEKWSLLYLQKLGPFAGLITNCMYNFHLCSLYGVVVVTGSALDRSPDDIINATGGNLPPPYPGQGGIYTTAVYTRPEDVPTIFEVGNNMITRGPNGREYINRRLNENSMYGVFNYIRLQSDSGVVVRNLSPDVTTVRVHQL